MTRRRSRSKVDLFNDVLLMTIAAFAFAGFLSVFVAIGAALRGSVTYPENGTTLGGIIGSYFAAAGIAGPIAGVLLPISRWRLGSAVLGGVAGVITYGAVAVASAGGLTVDGLEFALIVGFPVGAIVGFVLWSDPDEPTGGASPPV